jgi:hypothetical protein
MARTRRFRTGFWHPRALPAMLSLTAAAVAAGIRQIAAIITQADAAGTRR